MKNQTVLILERSSQNLKKISKDGRTVLEGVFAEFGVENRNGRVYEEREYLPHLEYLQKDIDNGNLLGELDHPERFEVSLGNVSHKISELWYDQGKRQILGRIEILDGTPKGQIAKSLLEAGVPLSISSRAAGSVNEDKSVAIQQIYTYDLVAKPGFESAQLHEVNEGMSAPKMNRIANLLESFNESFNKHEKDSINTELGIINENISIIDVSDKYPSEGSLQLREEAKSIIQKNKETMKNPNVKTEDATLNEWTEQFNEILGGLSTRLDNIENAILENDGISVSNKEIKSIKGYIEKIRKIQEQSINWQEDIAKAVNKVGNYSDMLAEKSNEHYELTQQLVETVDHNAKTLNATQDWVGSNANVTNAIAEATDYNATMLNGVNEWSGEMAKAINVLNEWGEEKAEAINGMHEWTSSLAKNLNQTANYTEDMFGRSMSKDDAKKLVSYIELVSESKQNPELKKKINEMLNKHSITSEKLNETKLKSLEVLDDTKIGKGGNVKVGDTKAKDKVDQFAGKNDSKPKSLKKGLPKGLTTLDDKKQARLVIGSNGKKYFVLDTTKTIGKGKEAVGKDGPTAKQVAMQKLKLKPGNLKEESKQLNIDRTLSIKTRSSKLDERLEKIVQSLEKERTLDESTKSDFPFTTLLSENDRSKFAALSASDKQKVATNVNKVPTIESEVIMKLWETALSGEDTSAPRWLELAPQNFKTIYESANTELKDSLTARASFYELSTQYQINNFWETSGLNATVSLNEDVIAKPGTPKTNAVDPMVAAIGAKMKSYNA